MSDNTVKWNYSGVWLNRFYCILEGFFVHYWLISFWSHLGHGEGPRQDQDLLLHQRPPHDNLWWKVRIDNQNICVESCMQWMYYNTSLNLSLEWTFLLALLILSSSLMLSFRYYNNFLEGEFILYRHKTLPYEVMPHDIFDYAWPSINVKMRVILCTLNQ